MHRTTDTLSLVIDRISVVSVKVHPSLLKLFQRYTVDLIQSPGVVKYDSKIVEVIHCFNFHTIVKPFFIF